MSSQSKKLRTEATLINFYQVQGVFLKGHPIGFTLYWLLILATLTELIVGSVTLISHPTAPVAEKIIVIEKAAIEKQTAPATIKQTPTHHKLTESSEDERKTPTLDKANQEIDQMLKKNIH